MMETASMATGFARRLKELRQKAELTQEQLARAAGVTTSAITKLEAGKVEPTWTTARAIAKALGVSVAEFEVDDDSPPSEQTAPPAEPEVKPKKRKPKK